MKELLEKATHFRKEFGDLYGVIDLNSLLDKIADKMRQYVNCRESAIFLYNAKREELYFETATGNRQDELKKIVLKKREGVVGWVAEEEKRLIINDCAKDPRFTSRIDRETDFKTAVGPSLSRPYIGDTPPSANGVPDNLPSGVAPTFFPIGTCAETV